MQEQLSHIFYGSTTISKKGQVVIPADARQAMELSDNEKLLVFGMGSDMLIFAKVSNLAKMMHLMEERLKMMKSVVKKTSNV